MEGKESKDRDEIELIFFSHSSQRPLAISFFGAAYENGHSGLEKDVTRAVEFYIAPLSSGRDANYNLGYTTRE